MRSIPSAITSLLATTFLLLSSSTMTTTVTNAQFVVSDTPGTFPACSVCGEGSVIANPTNFAFIGTTDGLKTCADMFLLGLNGQLENCPQAVGLTDFGVCFCTSIPLGESCNVCPLADEEGHVINLPDAEVPVDGLLEAAISIPVLDDLLRIIFGLDMETITCRQYGAVGSEVFLPTSFACDDLRDSKYGRAAGKTCGCAVPGSISSDGTGSFVASVVHAFCYVVPFFC